MRRKWGALALYLGAALVLSSLHGGAIRAAVIVADNFTPTFTASGFRTDVGYRSPSGSTPVFTNMAPSQRFVPQQGGTLAAVTTFLNRWYSVAPVLRVSIRADDGTGRPGAILGEQSFSPAGIPGSYFPPNPATTLDLSGLNLALVAGQPYHVVFRTDTALVSDMYYSLHMLNPHAKSFGFPAYESRDGGATWPVQSVAFSLEIPIQVSAVVPEPAAAAIAVVISGLLALRRVPPRRRFNKL